MRLIYLISIFINILLPLLLSPQVQSQAISPILQQFRVATNKRRGKDGSEMLPLFLLLLLSQLSQLISQIVQNLPANKIQQYLIKPVMNQSSADTSAFYEAEFRESVSLFAHGPVKSRTCRDVSCLIILIFVLILAIFGGIAFSYSKTKVVSKLPQLNPNGLISRSLSFFTGSFKQLILKNLGIIIGMGLVIMLVSFFFLILLQKFPKCVLVTALVMFCLLLLGALATLLLARLYLEAFFATIFLAVSVCVIFSFWGKIDAALIIMKLTTQFMVRNASIYIIPFFVGLLWIIVAVIIATLYAIGKITVNPTYLTDISIMSIPYLFASIFLYYVLVYLISSAVGNWFYEQPSIAAFAGLPHVSNHIGSFTFATFIIILMKILRTLADCKGRTMCLVQYFLTCVEAILQALNHFAVIVMSLTGQDFIDSAKTGSVILTSDIPLFAIIGTVESAISFVAILFNSLMTFVISLLIGRAVLEGPGTHFFFMMVSSILSIVISIFFVATFTASMNSLFIIYALENKLIVYGLKPVPVTQYGFQNAEEFMNSDLSSLTPKQMLDAGYPILSSYYDR